MTDPVASNDARPVVATSSSKAAGVSLMLVAFAALQVTVLQNVATANPSSLTTTVMSFTNP